MKQPAQTRDGLQAIHPARQVEVGDRVVLPFNIACGFCFNWLLTPG